MRQISIIDLARLALLSALAMLVAAPSALLADSAERMEEGRRLFEVEVDYVNALEVFRSIMEDEDALDEHRREARLQAAFCLVVLDRMEDAHLLMVQALIEDPDYELPPYTSPKLSEALEAARVEAVAQAQEDGEDDASAHEGDALAHVEPPAPPREIGRAGGPSLWPWSAAVGAGAVAALGTGAYYGIASSRSQDRYLNDPSSFASQSEALEFRETAIAQSRYASWLLISGAVLAVGSGALFALSDSGSSFSAAPIQDGLMLTAGRSW